MSILPASLSVEDASKHTSWFSPRP